MRMTIWLAGMLALGCGAAQAQDCRLKQYDTIAFNRTKQGLMLPVEIDGSPKDLALNLRDAQSALAVDVVKALDLRETNMPQRIHVSRGGVPVQYIAHAPTVKIGANTVKDMEFLVVQPVGDTDRAPGQIGTRVFNNADMELDMAGGKLNLFSPDHCPGKAVYWTSTGFAKVPLAIDDEGFIRVQMQLDGKPVTLGLNTDGRSVLSMKAVKRLFGLDSSSPGMTLAFTSPDGDKYYHYGFQSLTAEGLNIGHPDLVIHDDLDRNACVTGTHLKANLHAVSGALTYDALKETICHGGEDGNLGLSVLGKLHLYVSNKEKLLYLTGAGAH